DFLGLDTVDLIQASVENIMKNGKDAPNMTTLIHGDLADKLVYELFQQGETIGIFQFGSDMVRELLLRMKPTEFNDLAACTAVARPGPIDRKSTRLNSSHVSISYAVFCLKKKDQEE